MILKDKFTSASKFIEYAEYVSGFNFDDEKMAVWFKENPDFLLTYTGVMKAITPFIIGKKNIEGQSV
jgi:hypothetical protein